GVKALRGIVVAGQSLELRRNLRAGLDAALVAADLRLEIVLLLVLRLDLHVQTMQLSADEDDVWGIRALGSDCCGSYGRRIGGRFVKLSALVCDLPLNSFDIGIIRL